MNQYDYQGVNVITKFNSNVIDNVNQYLEDNGLNPFTQEQCSAIEALQKYDDILDIRHLDGYIRGDINYRQYSDIEFEYCYSIILKTGKCDTDLLFMDINNNPVCIIEDFCLE